MIAVPGASHSTKNTWSTPESLYQQLIELVFPQTGCKENDLITALPGLPAGDVSFAQYSGYVAVDPASTRNLFYYFVEAATNPASKPLVWWFDGGNEPIDWLSIDALYDIILMPREQERIELLTYQHISFMNYRFDALAIHANLSEELLYTGNANF